MVRKMLHIQVHAGETKQDYCIRCSWGDKRSADDADAGIAGAVPVGAAVAAAVGEAEEGDGDGAGRRDRRVGSLTQQRVGAGHRNGHHHRKGTRP